MMRNYLLSVLLVFSWVFSGFAQIPDVYTNKICEVSTSSFTLDKEKEYLSATESVYVDMPKNENKNWEKIDKQLKDLTIENVENEVLFFQLHRAIKTQLAIFKETSINTRDRNYEVNYAEPEFNSVRIKLLSIVNSFAVYEINYKFEAQNLTDHRTTKKLELKKYYLANLKSGQVQEIAKKTTVSQQEALKNVALNEIQKLYLLKTEKIAITDIDKIKSVQNLFQEEDSFATKIDFAEAVVFPFAFGLIVEFPEYSSTSKLFKGEAFRVFIRGKPLKTLIEKFPKYKSIFQKAIKPTTREIKEKLSGEAFNIRRLNNPPENEEVFSLFDLDKKVYKLTVETFNLKSEKVESVGKKIFRYNKTGQLELMENRGADNEVHGEIKYTYNATGKLIGEMAILNNRKEPVIYYYDDNELVFTEHFNLDTYGNPYDRNNSTYLKMWQQHHFSNANYLYSFRLNSFGEMDNYRIDSRWTAVNSICSLSNCILFDDENHIVGVQSKRQNPIEILTNTNGQVLETYSDRDRNKSLFKYDDKNRITEFKYFRDDKLDKFATYEYEESPENPLIIFKHIENKKEVYLLEFWE